MGALAALLALQARSATLHDDTAWRDGSLRVDLSLIAALLLAGAGLLLAGRRHADAAAPVSTPTLVAASRKILTAAASSSGLTLLGFGISLIAVPLAVTGFGAVVLGLAALLLVAALAIAPAWRWLAGGAAVLAASVAWGAGWHDHISRDGGLQVVQPRVPTQLDGLAYDPGVVDGWYPGYTATLRRGNAPVVIDLRRLRLRPGRAFTIRARSDLDRIVVMLPRDRCFRLDVRLHALDRRLPGIYEDAGRALGLPLPGTSGNAPAQPTYNQSTWVLGRPGASAFSGLSPEPALVAFGEELGPGTWTREVAPGRQAAALRLELTTRAQAYVRDYPDDWPVEVFTRAPGTANTFGGENRADEAQLLAWPAYRIGEPDGRTRDDMMPQTPWPKTPKQAAQAARRLAGACATRAEQARRWAVVVPGSSFPQPGERATYVNGVGERRTITVPAG